MTDLDVTADLEAIERDGFVVIDRLLDDTTLADVRKTLAPHLGAYRGRNDFEGHETERVYSLVSLGKVFEDLAEHPRIMAICDRLLEPNYLLTASQAIHIHPGETPQPFHTDDSFYHIARPRRAFSVSTIWAVDDFTAANGATEIVPGSHLWNDEDVAESIYHFDFETKAQGTRPSESQDEREQRIAAQARPVLMPGGSVIVFLGTLVHRGGRGKAAPPRLALSNQYCEPWARPQENFFLSIPGEQARAMSPRLQSLLGYSVHPPFMGHVRGVHPRRLLER